MAKFFINNVEVDGEARVSAWVQGGIDMTGVMYTEEFGKWLASNKFTTTQIRNIYGEVKRLQMKGDSNKSFDSELLLLKPKMAYVKARQQGKDASQSAEAFQKVLSKGIDAIFFPGHEKPENRGEKMNRFENFANIFEAILAYHRASGGK